VIEAHRIFSALSYKNSKEEDSAAVRHREKVNFR